MMQIKLTRKEGNQSPTANSRVLDINRYRTAKLLAAEKDEKTQLCIL